MTTEAAATLMFLAVWQVAAALLLAGQYWLWRHEQESAAWRADQGWCPDCDAIDADLARIDELLESGHIREARDAVSRLRDVLNGVDEAAAADARWARMMGARAA